MAQRLNALSIDLEEWYHPELVKRHCPEAAGHAQAKKSCRRLLELFDRHGCKATFFVVGEVAGAEPDLVREIHRRGHEIACHGFSHATLARLGPAGLEKELSRFRATVAPLIVPDTLKGFRAPSFSLTAETAWAVDILIAHGFRYDSSIFPLRVGSFYGVAGAPLKIYGLDARDIRHDHPASPLKEFPPAFGGFYLRLFPYRLQRAFLRTVNRTGPFMFYAHPWECDPSTPRIRLNAFSRFVSYCNIDSALCKLDRLLGDFRFSRADKVIGV